MEGFEGEFTGDENSENFGRAWSELGKNTSMRGKNRSSRCESDGDSRISASVATVRLRSRATCKSVKTDKGDFSRQPKSNQAV